MKLLEGIEKNATEKLPPNKPACRGLEKNSLQRKEDMLVRFTIPDFTLLTEMAPKAITLAGRVVIFHFPTHTILELLEAHNPLLHTITPRYEWERVNKYGEIEQFAFIVHRYVTDDLSKVFEQAKRWYAGILDSFDERQDEADEFLDVWEKRSDDLPN